MKRSWLFAAFLNLVIIAFLGLLLRWQFVSPVEGINFKNVLHAHSHAAILGWLYAAFFVALLQAFLPAELHQKKIYTWLFWLSQVSVLGMLISFPIQGYALYSITFSTAHILLSYWFMYRFLKDSRKAEASKKHPVSFLFIKAALFFMALSTLGPWSLGPIMAGGNSGSDLYYNAIYFYLHFQYNGWFSFAVLGLFFRLLEHYQIAFSTSRAKVFFKLLFWACIPAFFLSVLWTKPAGWVYVLAGAAALVQVFALVQLFRLIGPVWKPLLHTLKTGAGTLLLLSGTAFTLKIIMQAVTALPYMADLAFKLRTFIIGYLHLVLIGFVSLFLFAYFLQLGWLHLRNRLSRLGITLFVVAFIASEMLLFLQGTMDWLRLGQVPDYHLVLFGISCFMPVGLVLFLVSQVFFGGSFAADFPHRPHVKKLLKK